MPCIVFLGLIGGAPFYNIWSNENPLKLIMFLSISVYIAWGFDRFFTRDPLSPGREWAWVCICALLVFLGYGLLLNEALSIIHINHEYITYWYLIVIVAFLVIFGLIGSTRSLNPILSAQTTVTMTQKTSNTIVAVSVTDTPMPVEGGADSHSSHTYTLKRTGQNVSLAIMVMALFFYAIEITPDHGLHFKWGEVAAILIVFLLAELGVHLVVESARIKDEIIIATKVAEGVIKEARNVIEQAGLMKVSVEESTKKSDDVFASARTALVEADNRASVALAGLQDTANRLTHLVQTQLWSTVGPNFYNNTSIREDEFWNILERFIDSWLPKNVTNIDEATYRSIGILLNSFVGDHGKGTIRSTSGAIACVTADTVFAEASVAWLDSMAKSSKAKNESLVVWATSSLLPTDFAFPSIWWGPSGVESFKGNITRVEALHHFVGEVIKKRGGEKEIQDYRRITVFNPKTKRNGFIPYIAENMVNTLDNWLLWDPRINENGVFQSQEHASLILAQLAWKKDGQDANDFHPGSLELTWPMIQNLYGDRANDEGFMETHLFPDLAKSSSGVFNLYRYNYGTKNISLPGGVIAANSRILDQITMSSSELSDAGLSTDQVKQLRQKFPSKDLFSLRQIYSIMGWETLRDWYCKYMHLDSTGENSGAWWSIIKEDSFLAPLKLHWDGKEILPLDLLLIGTKAKESDEPTWRMAAVTNINSLRPECIVELIFDPARLCNIGNAVSKLCNDFNEPSEHITNEILTYNKWVNWCKSTNDILTKLSI